MLIPAQAKPATSKESTGVSSHPSNPLNPRLKFPLYSRNMFETLSEKLQRVFKNLRGEGRISQEHIEEALKEIRMALLEADVNFKVVKQFTDTIREKAVGQEVLQSLSPGQQVVKIVRDELVEIL